MEEITFSSVFKKLAIKIDGVDCLVAYGVDCMVTFVILCFVFNGI